jgi:HEPN domain-containing protein
MFLETADENYIVARWAFLHRLYVDFFWLSLHAVEKYFKAILLINGKSAKGFGHDIERLHSEVRSLDSRLDFGPLDKPAFMRRLKPELWRAETVESFIKRMNEMGDPNNRYMLYGFVVWSTDLFKLDRLVWSIRRHCRPFEQVLRADSNNERKIDWVEMLQRNRKYWTINGALEKLLDTKGRSEMRRALVTLNAPFAHGRRHSLKEWGSASKSPPLADWFERLRSQQASPQTKGVANATLQWVLDNVELAKKDRILLEGALSNHKGQSVSGP